MEQLLHPSVAVVVVARNSRTRDAGGEWHRMGISLGNAAQHAQDAMLFHQISSPSVLLFLLLCSRIRSR